MPNLSMGSETHTLGNRQSKVVGKRNGTSYIEEGEAKKGENRREAEGGDRTRVGQVDLTIA